MLLNTDHDDLSKELSGKNISSGTAFVNAGSLNNGTLFLFIKDDLYQNTSFSSAETGKEDIESLKPIVKKNLHDLEEYSFKKWYRLTHFVLIDHLIKKQKPPFGSSRFKI